MRALRPLDLSTSPLVREEELLRRLKASPVRGTERLRLLVAGRRLFLDGFVDSLDQKFQLERLCRELAPGSTVVNRLRVAAAEQSQVS